VVLVAGWIVVVFANSGVIITDSLMIILGVDILIAGLLARKVEHAEHDHSPPGCVTRV
jgi:hypothetical protein